MIKLKRIIDHVTAEQVLEVINSSLFVGGLAKCISHTQKSGYETRFQVTKIPNTNETYFSNIEVGNNNSVGGKERDCQLRAEFVKMFGEPPKLNEEVFSKGGEEVSRWNVKYQAYEEKFYSFVSSKREEVELEFPNLPLEREEIQSNYFPEAYQFLNLHTHPAQKVFNGIFRMSLCAPSSNDLSNVASKRIEASKENIDEEIFYYKPSVIVNPLSMIASTLTAARGVYRLGLIGVHNTNGLTTSIVNEEKKKISEFCFSLNPEREDCRFYFSDFFSFAKGFYNPRTRKVVFEPSSLDAMLDVWD
jgi:hypothetical protein